MIDREAFCVARVGARERGADRAAAAEGRGNAALRKIGARQEGILRKSFFRNGEYLDQALWTVLDEDWRARAFFGAGRIILH